jgi:thiol-disulfide isomerase/thioredoxin
MQKMSTLIPPPPAKPKPPFTANMLPVGFKMVEPPLQLGDLTFQDADGKTVKISDFHGEPVVLNVWAKWCAPCVTELPTLNELQSKIVKGTLAVVAVAVDEPDPAKVRNFLNNRNLSALKPYLDPKSAIAEKLKITTIPSSFLIDKNGFAVVRVDLPVIWYSDPAIILLQRSIL